MIWKYLYQRYPSERNKWKLIIPISFFVAFFIIIFQPFGLNELELENKLIILAGYGLVTFIILVFNMIFLPAIFPVTFGEEKWTVMKEMLFLFWIIFTVGLGNFLYSAWTIGFHLTIANILGFQIFTLAIGIIPITTLILIKQNYLRRKNEDSAGIISASLGSRKKKEPGKQIIRISSDNEKEGVDLQVQDLLFIKSDGNYITIGYLQDGKAGDILLRNTLKYASELFYSFPNIFQCHRSWLVNLDRISRVTGNSQGLRIEIEGWEDDIPVARKQMAEFKEKLTQKMS